MRSVNIVAKWTVERDYKIYNYNYKLDINDYTYYSLGPDEVMRVAHAVRDGMRMNGIDADIIVREDEYIEIIMP